jgi:hypothetical protein
MSTATYESNLTEDGLWKNPWGYESSSQPPAKVELFPAEDSAPEDLWLACTSIEDFLQHNAVFVNGIRNTPCHMDSYMTCVVYARLDRCLEILEKQYAPTKEQWKRLTNHWLCNANTQPPARICALHICSRYNIAPGRVDESQWK